MIKSFWSCIFFWHSSTCSILFFIFWSLSLSLANKSWFSRCRLLSRRRSSSMLFFSYTTYFYWSLMISLRSSNFNLVLFCLSASYLFVWFNFDTSFSKELIFPSSLLICCLYSLVLSCSISIWLLVFSLSYECVEIIDFLSYSSLRNDYTLQLS